MKHRTHSDLLPLVRDCLWQVWDPIGVNEYAEAKDEYDSYAPKITTMLLNGVDARELASHLRHIEAVTMGLPANYSTTDAAVVSLLELIDR